MSSNGPNEGELSEESFARIEEIGDSFLTPVSYTHLTLPTKA